MDNNYKKVILSVYEIEFLKISLDLTKQLTEGNRIKFFKTLDELVIPNAKDKIIFECNSLILKLSEA